MYGDGFRTDESRRAVIAMSGGVDSSVAAFLMKEAGYTCIGATMKLFANEEIGISGEHTCCSLEDVEDAKNVARTLGIPHYVFNFSERFRTEVMERFVRSYENGVTPNPCIDCNRYLKFDQLFRRAREIGCGFVVTGHYAWVERDPDSGRFLLKKALDAQKDQSYVLYSLNQEQLSHVQFPLGALQKEQVRRIAAEQGFVNAGKHDSQDICFVPGGSYADFIRNFTGKEYPPGDFVDEDGNVLGRHKGVIHYTLGQRKGLGLSFPQPMYVTAIDPVRNTVTLGPHASLFSRELTARDINLISVDHIDGEMRVKAKVRYRQQEQAALVCQTDGDELRIVFDEPQRAITPGQAVVLYDGDTVVGGGRIAEVPGR